MSTKKTTVAERTASIENLREIIKPGDTITCVLRHCSASGMSRSISLLIPTTNTDGKVSIRTIDWTAARAMDRTFDDKNGGIKIQGCGMDLGFALVYDLGRALFPDGGSLEFSPRKYQEEKAGRTTETDGGYLLHSTWL